MNGAPDEGFPGCGGVPGEEHARSAPAVAGEEARLALEDLFENGAVGLHLVAADGRILRANRAELALLGYAAEEYVGRHIAEFHADPATIAEILARLSRGEVLEKFPARLRAKDGSIKHVQISSSVKFKDGRFVNTRCFTIDVTQQRLAEEAQRRSEARLRAVLDNLPQKIWLTSADGSRHIYLNRRFQEELGDAADWGDHLHPEDRARHFAARKGAVASGRGFVIESRFRGRDGVYRWHLVRMEPLLDADGRPSAWLGSLTDIDAVVQAKQELRELNETLERKVAERTRELDNHRERLNTYFQYSPDWMTLHRFLPDGRLVFVDINPACERAYGMKRETVIGRSFAEFVGEEPARLPYEKARACVASGRAQRYVTERTIGGRTRTIDVLLVPLAGEGPNGECDVLMSARDITEHELLQAQLRQAQKMEAVGQLASGVAHDFNNLLTAVLGNLELAEMRVADEGVRKLIGAAARSARRGSQLNEQMLAFSRKQHLAPKPVDLGTVLGAAGEILRRTLGGTIEVKAAVASDLWPALVDPTQLELVLLNLGINARDAMPLGGTLLIEARNLHAGAAGRPGELGLGDYVAIAVTDTGSGMSEEVLARAFEPFYTTKPPGKGSGLGLSQVYGFARQSGGTAAIRSALGKGTTVEVFLPRSTDPAEADPAGGLSDVAGRSSAATVLVIDDQEDVREVAAAYLASLGYAVVQATTGAAALDLLGPGIDVLLADYAMPGMTGIELAEAARERRPDLPVVIVTGYADMDSLEGRIEGAVLLKKPYRRTELAASVERAFAAAPRLPGTVHKLRPKKGRHGP